MPLKYRIAKVYRANDNYAFADKSCLVDEKLFLSILQSKIKNITQHKPEEYDRVLNESYNTIYMENNSLTIEDICFTVNRK
jgi:hypothetical protein